LIKPAKGRRKTTTIRERIKKGSQVITSEPNSSIHVFESINGFYGSNNEGKEGKGNPEHIWGLGKEIGVNYKGSEKSILNKLVLMEDKARSALKKGCKVTSRREKNSVL